MIGEARAEARQKLVQTVIAVVQMQPHCGREAAHQIGTLCQGEKQKKQERDEIGSSVPVRQAVQSGGVPRLCSAKKVESTVEADFSSITSQ
jgi:hypothetical protein